MVLWIIIIFDIFQLLGRWPRRKEALKKQLIVDWVSGGSSFNILLVMLSFPGAPDCLQVDSAANISSVVMSGSGVGWAWLLSGGRGLFLLE